jgi:hypothetical protein
MWMAASHQRPELGTDFTEVLTMNRFSMKHSQRLQTVWPIVLLLFITPANAQSIDYEFKDSHFHPTNTVQEDRAFKSFSK